MMTLSNVCPRASWIVIMREFTPDPYPWSFNSFYSSCAWARYRVLSLQVGISVPVYLREYLREWTMGLAEQMLLFTPSTAQVTSMGLWCVQGISHNIFAVKLVRLYLRSNRFCRFKATDLYLYKLQFIKGITIVQITILK